MFVGNDAGVWALHTPGGKVEKTNGKYAWVDISANLPNAIVTDLVYHDQSKSLTAATYGRSLWWFKQGQWTTICSSHSCSAQKE